MDFDENYDENNPEKYFEEIDKTIDRIRENVGPFLMNILSKYSEDLFRECANECGKLSNSVMISRKNKWMKYWHKLMEDSSVPDVTREFNSVLIEELTGERANRDALDVQIKIVDAIQDFLSSRPDDEQNAREIKQNEETKRDMHNRRKEHADNTDESIESLEGKLLLDGKVCSSWLKVCRFRD